MPYNVLLLPLLGGFIFISFWDRTRWHTQRAEKERLLLYAAIAGFACLAIAILIRSLFRYCLIDPSCPWWNRNVGLPSSGVGTLALLLGASGWYPLNKFADWYFQEWAAGDESGSKRREFVRIVDNYGGPLEQLLLRSMEYEEAVMLTLKGGKVYIGKMAAGFVPDRDKTIYLLPRKSGYRDAKQRLVLTTHYDQIYGAIEADYKKLRANEPDDSSSELLVEMQRTIGAFGVVVPVAEVIAASLYVPEIHTNYFAHLESEDKKPDPTHIIGHLRLTHETQLPEEPLEAD